MTACRLCRANSDSLLEFGPQPLCSQYLGSPQQPGSSFSMSLRLCPACGVTQLGEAPELSQLEDHPDWISYREAEHHLDEVAAWCAQSPAKLRVRGLSFKDDPLLARLAAQGIQDLRRYRPEELGLLPGREGIESIQGRLTQARVAAILTAEGPCDLLLARHILEHAQDLGEFLACLRSLLAPGGRLLLELPDSSRSLAQLDYSMPWEEHLFYFTSETLAQVWRVYGWQVLDQGRYAYQPEDVLLYLLTPAAAAPVEPVKASLALARDYAAGFAQTAALWRAKLQDWRAKGPVALLGAGHLGCSFINLLGLADCIDYVIDDDPHKQGLYMPGSGLAIRSSRVLSEAGVSLCLLSINPDSEQRVIDRFRSPDGPVFASIFPASRFKLEKGEAPKMHTLLDGF